MKALQQEGLTLQELRGRTSSGSYLCCRPCSSRKSCRAMTITDEEKRQYYAAHPDEFMTASDRDDPRALRAVPATTQGGQRL